MSVDLNDEPYVSFLRTIHFPDLDSAFKIFQTHWRITKSDWKRPLHDHPIFELNVVLDGMQDVLVGGTSYEMNKGDILIIHPGIPHHVTGTRGNEVTYFVMHFDVEDYMFRAILSMTRCGHHVYNSHVEQQIRKPIHDIIALLKTYENQDLSYPAPRLKMLSHIFALFSALSNEEPEKWHAADTRGGGYQVAYRMAEQIDLSIKSGERDISAFELRIALLADNLGYSPSYCYQMFRKVFGVSPKGYMSNAILHRARLELLNLTQSMDQIAYRLGFQDGAHFSKQFKRWTGCSPTLYRKQQQHLLEF
jgi:AraC-like DNA-binding protein